MFMFGNTQCLCLCQSVCVDGKSWALIMGAGIDTHVLATTSRLFDYV